MPSAKTPDYFGIVENISETENNFSLWFLNVSKSL